MLEGSYFHCAYAGKCEMQAGFWEAGTGLVAAAGVPGLSMAGQQTWAEVLRKPLEGTLLGEIAPAQAGRMSRERHPYCQDQKLFFQWIFLGFIPLSWIVGRQQEMECTPAAYNKKWNSHPLYTWCWLCHLLPRRPSTDWLWLAWLNFWISASTLRRCLWMLLVSKVQEVHYQNNQRSASHSKDLWS